MRNGHGGQRHLVLDSALEGDQTTVFDKDRAPSLGQMGGHDGVVAVGGKKGDGAATVAGHGHHDGIGRIEDGHAVIGDVLHDHTLEHGQILDRGDVVQPQMVAAADVGDDRHIAMVKRQTFTQHAAAGGLQHRRIHVGVLQHIARALGAAAVAGVDALARDVDAIGIGHAHTQTVLRQQVGDQAHGGGFAVGTGHRHQWNTAILLLGEHAGDDGFAHRAALAVGGGNMHAQARRGIDLDHATALLLQRMQDAAADHVHAANIESHHLRSSHRTRGHLGVDIVGDVGGRAAGRQVGVVAQGNACALDRHRVGLETLAGQAAQGNIVKADFGQ